MKIITIFIASLTALAFGAMAAFADDMWSETPDLENLKTPSFVSEPSRLSNTLLKIDMWAETPALDGNRGTIDFLNEPVIVESGPADQELYAETPNLKKILPGKRGHQSPANILTAEKERKGVDRTEDKRI